MDIFKIIAIGLITVIMILVIKPTKPEIAILLGLAGSIIIFLFVIDMLDKVFSFFNQVVEKTGINGNLFTTLLKIIGVGYLAEFSASLCNDSGNNGIGEKILFAGKITILILSLPIFESILKIIMSLL